MNTKLIFGLLCCALQVQIHAVGEKVLTKKEVKQLQRQARNRARIINGHLDSRLTQHVPLTEEQKLHKLRQMSSLNNHPNRSKL